MLPVERKACYDVVNAFLSRLELIWLISRLKISKKLHFFCKKVWESMGKLDLVTVQSFCFPFSHVLDSV